MSCTAPDGVQTFMPWTKLVTFRECDRAFTLLDHKGHALGQLPKRGLPSTDLIPVLRDYLNHSIGKQPTVAAAMDGAAESCPRDAPEEP